jgi:hypothetical protein
MDANEKGFRNPESPVEDAALLGPSAVVRVIRVKFRMPDEMLTHSATTFNRFENLFVSFVTLCKMVRGPSLN